MTIASQTRTAGPFSGTGLVVSYPFSFKVFQASDVLVTQTDPQGNVTTPSLGGGYTVTLNSDQNTSPGGIVTPLAALGIGYKWLLSSSVSLTQGASLTNAGGFFPRTIEDALDRLTILMQQQTVNNASALRVPEFGGLAALPAASQRASQLVGFDEVGSAVLYAPGSVSMNVVSQPKSETQTLSVGQTLVTLATFTYPSSKANAITVFLDGQEINDFVQTSDSSLTLTTTPAFAHQIEVKTNSFASFGNGTTAARDMPISAVTGPSFEFRRDVNTVGGDPTKVNSAVRAVSFVNTATTTLEWTGLFEMHNSSPYGENVAVYGQGTKNFGAGATWAGVFEGIDLSGGNPTSGCLGLEVDVRGDNGDSFNNRIAIDIVVTKPTGSVAASMTAGYGVRFQTNNDATCSYGTLIGTAPNVHAGLGIDLSGAIIVGAAVKLGNAQSVQFDTSTLQSTSDNGIDHSHNGVFQNRLLPTGGLQVHTTKVVGDRQTGWGLPTGTLRRLTFDPSTVTQLQVAQTLAALITDLFGSGTGHGLIGA